MCNFSSRVQLEEKFHIYARPCIILYIFPDIPLNTEAISISLKGYYFVVFLIYFWKCLLTSNGNSSKNYSMCVVRNCTTIVL